MPILHRSPSKHLEQLQQRNALLKSYSLFRYFMLVAFEAGGLLRAIVLVLLYPFVCVVGSEMGLKIMVMTCFFGMKASSFRVGRSVLPKFLLEDVGAEMFETLKKGGKQVGVTKLPRVMVELGKKMNSDWGSRFGDFNRFYGFGYSKNRGLKWLNGLGRRGPEAKGGGADENFKLGFLGRVIGFGSISTEA